MKRVGFLMNPDNKGWLGGVNYFRNLFAAVFSNPERLIQPVLFMPNGNVALDGFSDIEIVRTPMADMRSPLRKVGQASRRLVGRDLALERLMRTHRIDVLSHSGATGRASGMPSISWIPDFQHVRMPEFFSEKERATRDATYRRLAIDSSLVVLSSQDAASDFARFAPQQAGKARVLHFVSGFSDVGAVLSLEYLRQRFQFDRPYFHLPNQFWKHKNHAVVIEALGILKRNGLNPLVLATGSTRDYRHSGHFEELTARVKELGVENNFRALGVVELQELQSLMLHSMALINPSRFEGWSTTVEESKSLGVPIILSDIPVHIEQDPPLGSYFAVDSASSLAEKMAIHAADPNAAGSRLAAREYAVKKHPERVRAFSLKFQEIAIEAVRSHTVPDRN